MIGGRYLKGSGAITLFLFIFMIISTNVAPAQEKDSLTKAQQLYQKGDYEGTIDLLSKFIEKLKAMVEQKKNVAEAFYLLAKIYFEVGDDAKVDENLKKVFHTYPAFSKEETNYGFKERVEKVKTQMMEAKDQDSKTSGVEPTKTTPQTKVETEEFTPTKQVIQQPVKKKAKKKKKFPVLLVVGGIAVVAILAILLLKKKKDDPYNIRGDWSVNTNFLGDSGLFFMTFRGGINSGTFVDHEGDTGTYSVNDRSVSFRYDDYDITFNGSFNSHDTMSGSLDVAGIGGSWSASRGFNGAMAQSLMGLKAKAVR
jgi:hypothetical protein